MPFSDSIARVDTRIPVEYATEIISHTPKASAILAGARHVPMSTSKKSQPVLAVLPEAYWVDGDSALKQTTKAAWENLVITAEELAALVVVPDAVMNDSDIPIWSQLVPLLAEAIGKKVDAAGLWDVSAPTSWPTGIIPAATAAGNVINVAVGDDIGAAAAQLAGDVAESGEYNPTGWVTRPGFEWRLRALRGNNGQPIYDGGALYGMPATSAAYWATTAPVTNLAAIDWSRYVVGIRQDITMQKFEGSVISDATGAVVYNAMQQDGAIYRVVFRVGFQAALPTTATGYPAGVLTVGV